ncbi:unnamed protein product [Rhodiola kirilowii]
MSMALSAVSSILGHPQLPPLPFSFFSISKSKPPFFFSFPSHLFSTLSRLLNRIQSSVGGWRREIRRGIISVWIINDRNKESQPNWFD